MYQVRPTRFKGLGVFASRPIARGTRIFSEQPIFGISQDEHASDVYRNTGPSGAAQAGKPGMVGKRRNNITVQNWQYLHAKEARYVL